MYINLDLTIGFDFAYVHAPILGGELASVVLKFAWPVIGGYLGQIMGIPSSDGAFFFPITMPSRYLI